MSDLTLLNQDLVAPWQAHLGFNLTVTDHGSSEILNKDAGCNAITDSGAVAADDLTSEEKTLVTDHDPSAISNKDGYCNAITDSDSHRIPPQTVTGSSLDPSVQQNAV
ncbi:MAG TPA: hypothetical protein VHA33_30305 [Candidatus Angelobacter sp.]|jgi:hypothetical protein|nr:hypothetical protein [Candidatus Angelobacter sp.]